MVDRRRSSQTARCIDPPNRKPAHRDERGGNLPAFGERDSFCAMTSWSVWFSMERSVDIRLSRLYSCSSFLLRVTSEVSSPPYVAFPLSYVAALRPYCRQLSVTGRPASASFRSAQNRHDWGLGELRRAQGKLLAQGELLCQNVLCRCLRLREAYSCPSCSIITVSLLIMA